MSMPNLSLEMNDEGSSCASQRSNFRPCHNSPEWLRSIQNWRGYVPADEISALIDACDNAPFAAVKSGSVDDRDDGRNNRETSQIRVCFGLPCALAGAEPFCDAITSTGSGLRIIHETCMARCWMAPVRNGRRRRHIRYRPRGDGESLEWCATHFEQRNFVRLYECCRIRRSQKLSRQATFCREHRLCVVCFSARSI